MTEDDGFENDDARALFLRERGWRIVIGDHSHYWEKGVYQLGTRPAVLVELSEPQRYRD